MTGSGLRRSLGFDPQFLDDRPPFLGIGLHKRAEVAAECYPNFPNWPSDFWNFVGKTRVASKGDEAETRVVKTYPLFGF
jgi:hypothetical protein